MVQYLLDLWETLMEREAIELLVGLGMALVAGIAYLIEDRKFKQMLEIEMAAKLGKPIIGGTELSEVTCSNNSPKGKGRDSYRIDARLVKRITQLSDGSIRVEFRSGRVLTYTKDRVIKSVILKK